MSSSLAALCGLPSLTSLGIIACEFAANSLQDLKSVTQLRELALEDSGSNEHEEDDPTLDVSACVCVCGCMHAHTRAGGLGLE